MTDRNSMIQELEEKAATILLEKRRQIPRRPIVIEFCGTPKSGKTTCINGLNIFLKRNGFKTQLLTERASVCPISDKHNPNFNIWTTCMALAETAFFCTEKNKELDVIILDRGIFDGLCWFQWLHDSERLNSSDFSILSTFLTKNIVVPKIDIVYVFDVDAEESVKREYANLLTDKAGSIMNKKSLQSFSTATMKAIANFSASFNRVEQINTTDTMQNDVNYKVTSQILSNLSDMVEEKIGYIDIQHFDSFIDRLCFEHRDISKTLQLKFAPRSEIENDDSRLQVIPIAAITSEDDSRIFVVRKSPQATHEGSAEKDRTLGYIGGHIRLEDSQPNKNDFLKTIKTALARESFEEVRQSFAFEDNNPIYIWDKSSPKSKRHLAICFHKRVDFDNTKFKLDKDEFVSKSNSKKSGQILTTDEITKEKLEPWTKTIVQKFLTKQHSLFDVQ